jgi:hypothetical protein
MCEHSRRHERGTRRVTGRAARGGVGDGVPGLRGDLCDVAERRDHGLRVDPPRRHGDRIQARQVVSKSAEVRATRSVLQRRATGHQGGDRAAASNLSNEKVSPLGDVGFHVGDESRSVGTS